MVDSSKSGKIPVTARGQRTRKKLLAAAEQVFGSLGYDGASVSEITRTAGVGQGTFYVYFPSKKELFTELIWDLNRSLRYAVKVAVDALDAPTRFDIERAAARAFLDFVREHTGLYRVVRQAEFVDARLYQAYYEKLAAGYRWGLMQAMDAGEIRRLDPEATVYMLMGILDFLGMRFVLWDDTVPSEAVLDDVLTFIRHGLDARPRSEPG